MKRVASACLYQTFHFILDPKLEINEAILKVDDEVKAYKAQMGDGIQIMHEEKLQDGTVILKIRKKVSGYPIGEYFD